MKKIIFCLLALSFIVSCTESLDFRGETTSSGETLSGSYAAMLTIGTNLYLVNKTELHTYNISNKENPILVSKSNVGFEVESMYHRDGILYIGSQSFLYIYRIGQNGVPLRESQTNYFDDDNTSCDPVITVGSIAYVTLSTNLVGPCGNGFRQVNELRVYDIKDIQKPKLLNTIQMSEPKGLAAKDGYLYVCEANDGVKVFDIKKPEEPKLVFHTPGFRAFDVIPNGNVLIVSGGKTVTQFDLTSAPNLKYISDFNF